MRASLDDEEEDSIEEPPSPKLICKNSHKKF